MTENKKRFRIDFTVDAEGWSDDYIKESAIQELTCMVPYPEDISFSEVDNPWHTGTPTETGEYLVCRIPEAGYLFRYNQLCVFSDLMGILDHKIFYIGEVGKNSFENITDSVIAWQKIEPYEERE